MGKSIINLSSVTTVGLDLASTFFKSVALMLQNGLWSPRQVMSSGAAELVPITIGRDYGDRVEVLTGLDAADEVIINPSDSLVSGAAIWLVNHKAGGAA
jgi:multidrug efflux pump subunit AcrA (membrane-fusion protein)